MNWDKTANLQKKQLLIEQIIIKSKISCNFVGHFSTKFKTYLIFKS